MKSGAPSKYFEETFFGYLKVLLYNSKHAAL